MVVETNFTEIDLFCHKTNKSSEVSPRFSYVILFPVTAENMGLDKVELTHSAEENTLQTYVGFN